MPAGGSGTVMDTSHDPTIGDLQADEAGAAVALWDDAKLTRRWNDPDADIRLAPRGAHATVLAGRIGGRLVATVMRAAVAAAIAAPPPWPTALHGRWLAASAARPPACRLAPAG